MHTLHVEEETAPSRPMRLKKMWRGVGAALGAQKGFFGVVYLDIVSLIIRKIKYVRVTTH
jgi:hypothetical protein